MKKIVAIILTLITAVVGVMAFSGCKKYDGKLLVGVTDYKPMDYKENGEWIGFDADLAREVCKLMNYDIEFIEIDWDNKIMSIDTGEIDVIWNGMTITDDLKNALALTEPYLENNQVIICQKAEAEKYATKAGLANASEILVEAGSAGEDAVKEAGFESKMTTAAAQKDTIIEVKSSASKVAVIDKMMAKCVVGEGTANPDLTYVEVGFELEQFGIGFRKEDTELKQKVEDAIKTLKENGVYDQLMSKYFG